MAQKKHHHRIRSLVAGLSQNFTSTIQFNYVPLYFSIHTEDSGEQQDASSDIDDYVLIDAEALNGSQKTNTVLAYVQIIYASLFAWVLGVIEDFSDGPTDPYPNAFNKKSQGLSVNR